LVAGFLLIRFGEVFNQVGQGINYKGVILVFLAIRINVLNQPFS